MTSPEPIPLPESLPGLLDVETRLDALLEVIDVHLENLDSQAVYVHTGLVIPAYEAMKSDVAQACGKRWSNDRRKQFRTTYHDVASKWMAYKAALAVLNLAPEGSTANVDAMIRLEIPRRGYIEALSDFYDEFSATLRFLFPFCFPSS
jgi:hypothetical protein